MQVLLLCFSNGKETLVWSRTTHDLSNNVSLDDATFLAPTRLELTNAQLFGVHRIPVLWQHLLSIHSKRRDAHDRLPVLLFPSPAPSSD
jgi:hypothetical protein